MSNVFVVTSTPEVGADKDPRIAYDNLADTAVTVTASHDSANTGYLYDGMTTNKWRPANAAPYVQFDGSFQDVDYIGVVGCNWATAGATLTVKDSGGATVAEASGLRDNQPLLLIVTKATFTTLKFEFSCSNTSLEVGEIYFGESMLLPRNVAVGYQPGRWTRDDEVTLQRTENNQFAGSIVRARGTSESFSIRFVPTSYMETTWITFINAATGLPIFFLWNKDNEEQACYGHWRANNPRFDSSLFSSIRITINGVA